MLIFYPLRKQQWSHIYSYVYLSLTIRKVRRRLFKPNDSKSHGLINHATWTITVENYGLFGWYSNLSRQTYGKLWLQTESLASKIEATIITKFIKKISLWHVGHGANKVWHAIVVATNQTMAKKNCGMTNLWHGTLWSRTKQVLHRHDHNE